MNISELIEFDKILHTLNLPVYKKDWCYHIAMPGFDDFIDYIEDFETAKRDLYNIIQRQLDIIGVEIRDNRSLLKVVKTQRKIMQRNYFKNPIVDTRFCPLSNTKDLTKNSNRRPIVPPPSLHSKG